MGEKKLAFKLELARVAKIKEPLCRTSLFLKGTSLLSRLSRKVYSVDSTTLFQFQAFLMTNEDFLYILKGFS